MEKQSGLEDFKTALGALESGNNYSVTNTFGYLGRYQFGELALIDAGYYSGRDGTSSNDFIGTWTGRFGVNSAEDFLNSPEAQEDAANTYITTLWRYIRALDLEAYAGQTINGVQLTVSGMIGGAWLVGAGGLRTFISSGGSETPSDAFSTQVTKYISGLGGHDLSSLGSFVTNSEQANTLSGGAGPDALYGRGGNDTLSALDGNDVVVGGAGADQVFGGDGDDEIWAGADDDGSDTIEAGAGNDRLAGGPESDLLSGQDGDDSVFGGTGNDQIHGGAGEDWMWAGDGNDAVSGGTGGDTIGGGQGNDTIEGGEGDDTVYASTGDDHVSGGDGHDQLFGGAGDDTLSGGTGNDSMFGGASNDIFIFEDNHGTDYIGGFKTMGTNKIDLSALKIADFSTLSITQTGNDTVIETGEGRIVFWNTLSSDLTEGDFVL